MGGGTASHEDSPTPPNQRRLRHDGLGGDGACLRDVESRRSFPPSNCGSCLFIPVLLADVSACFASTSPLVCGDTVPVRAANGCFALRSHAGYHSGNGTAPDQLYQASASAGQSVVHEAAGTGSHLHLMPATLSIWGACPIARSSHLPADASARICILPLQPCLSDGLHISRPARCCRWLPRYRCLVGRPVLEGL